MENNEIPGWADEIDSVVQDSIRFKIKLDIGEEAYTSLKMKRYFLDAVDAGNGVVTGVAIAKSSAVATTFFAPSGILGVIGIGTAATPIGWAIAAGVLGAGLSVAIGKQFVRGGSSRVSTIPDFINTPLDILAVGLFDLIGMLSIKVAAIDGCIDEDEKKVIVDYFVNEWGYDRLFVMRGLLEIEKVADEHTVKSVAENLAQFKKDNPDCNYSSMAKEIIGFLQEVIEADCRIDEREEMALERVDRIFTEVGSFSLSKTAQAGLDVVSNTSKKGVEALSVGVSGAGKTLGDVGTKLKEKFSKG